MAAVSGRKLSPARSGEKPSTSCTYKDAKKNTANIPPVTVSIVRFAARIGRSLKIDRRTSGSVTRASISTNPTSSTIPPIRNPSVRTLAHPYWLAPTIPYTIAMSPAVAVTAPPTSNPRRPSRFAGAIAGRIRHDSAMTTMPTGMLIRKFHRQDRYSVSAPPTISPIDAPPTAIAAHTARALARWRPSVNVVVTIERAIGEISAAPKPWTPRKTISIPAVVPIAFISDASVKIATPSRNSRLRPNRSPARPPSSRKPPSTSV